MQPTDPIMCGILFRPCWAHIDRLTNALADSVLKQNLAGIVAGLYSDVGSCGPLSAPGNCSHIHRYGDSLRTLCWACSWLSVAQLDAVSLPAIGGLIVAVVASISSNWADPIKQAGPTLHHILHRSC
jgi:hypothetical protein